MDEPSYEKLSIRESARSLKKYGSTSSKLATKSENYIKHYVCNTDTLQGIASKYDVSIEQIRRANRLWTSDSLFLKEFLLIPVPLNVSVSAASASTSSTPVSSPLQSPPSYEDEDNIDRFLGKIDASIATTKEEVKKTQSNSEFASDLSFDIDRRKPIVSRMKQMVNNNGIGDLLPPPPPQTVVIAQGKLVKTTIRRTEQKTDEFFES